MGKKPENLLVDERIGALRSDSHLPAALKKRILKVGNDLEAPGFMRAFLVALVHCCDQPAARVRVAELQAWLGVHRQLWLSDRTIKRAVMLLVADYDVQVGSSRITHSKQQGYYFITTPAEAARRHQAPVQRSQIPPASRPSTVAVPFLRRRMCGQLEVEL
jgi:hypothetical protein